jgi:hypothetical protein
VGTGSGGDGAHLVGLPLPFLPTILLLKSPHTTYEWRRAGRGDAHTRGWQAAFKALKQVKR